MKRLFLLLVLLLPVTAHAQYQFATDFMNVTTSAVKTLDMTDISAIRIVAWWIKNTDASDTLMIEGDGSTPAAGSSLYLLPGESLSISTPGVNAVNMKDKSGTSIPVESIRIYERRP